MEPRKYHSAEIARFQFLFLNIGLVITLLIIITAFEYRFYDAGQVVMKKDITDFTPVIEQVKPTIQEPPRPVYQQPRIIEIKTEEIKPEDFNYTFDNPVFELSDVQDIMSDIPEERVQTIVDFAEIMPSPVGGLKTFYEYLAKNIQYPARAMQLGIEGKVFLAFVVDIDGSISDVEVLKGIGGGCDEEAVRVLQNAPKWNPGQQGSRKVSVRMRLPITFKLKK